MIFGVRGGVSFRLEAVFGFFFTRTLFQRRALLPAEGGSVSVLRLSVAARRLQLFPVADFFENHMA